MCARNQIQPQKRWPKTNYILPLLAITLANAGPAGSYDFKQEAKLQRARDLYSAGHFLEARAIVGPMCNKPDSTAPMYCLLAETYIDDPEQLTKDGPKIENALHSALKIDPNYSLTYKDLAEYYNCLGDYKRAIENSSIALKLPHPYIYTLRQRAIAYSNSGQYDKALADIDKFISLEKPAEPTYIMKAGILEKMKRYDDAVATYRKAFELRHQDMTLYSITRCFEMQHKYAEATTEVSRVIKMNPHDAEALAVRGRLQSQCKNYAEALKDFSKAIDIEPTVRLYKSRASAYQKLGQKQAAERDLASAIKLDEGNF